MLFCRTAQEEANIGERYFEIDRTVLESMIEKAKIELKGNWFVCIPV